MSNQPLNYLKDMDREEVAKGCLDQAGWAAKLGSPMYEGLLRRMAEDVRAGGPCLTALEPHSARSPMGAPLLLLAAIHRMVLEDRLPEAARFYIGVWARGCSIALAGL